MGLKSRLNLKKVTIIILNWNGWQDTLECLASVFKIKYQNFEVVVVDNGSTNASADEIEKWSMKKNRRTKFHLFSMNAKSLSTNTYLKIRKKLNVLSSKQKLLLIKSKINLGFSEGNNLILRKILKDEKKGYILLLNNDTIVPENFLNTLVEGIENYPAAVIAGPKTYYFNFANKKNIIWFGGGSIDWKRYPGYFHSYYNQKDRKSFSNSIVSTKWVSGACMLVDIEKAVLDDGNLLSKDFYLGGEDVDLCLRNRARGFKVLYNPRSYIWHKVGRSRPLSLKQVFRSTKTNLKLNRKYNSSFFLYLPKYLLTVPIRYFKLLLVKKLSS